MIKQIGQALIQLAGILAFLCLVGAFFFYGPMPEKATGAAQKRVEPVAIHSQPPQASPVTHKRRWMHKPIKRRRAKR